MTQQKSEARIRAQGRGKVAVTHSVEPDAGAKACPVNQERKQTSLPFETAEVPARAGSDVRAARPRGRTTRHAVPLSKSKRRKAESATIEAVTEGLEEAFQQVYRNQGAPGPNRQTIEQVRVHWSQIEPGLRKALLEGSYQPGDIRRVWIPKSGGGQRGLGIPDVIDRVVQEATRRQLEPLYEPRFHASSHGFRPDRSCHTAVTEAVQHLDEGYGWVVDLDLEKFFDRVNRQRLLSRLALRVRDGRLLSLIGRMLRANVVLPDGVVVSTTEGLPQGGPLSPLLSNVVLDELDQELARRGHRFVRYADDCNVYVRSERAGQRVMASIQAFIEKRLRLQVNVGKSAVARPEERHFLGFRLRREPRDGSVQVLLSKRSKERAIERIRQLTPRNWGCSVRKCIEQVNGYLRGWIEFFGVCTKEAESDLSALDGHLRRRLRAIQLKHWKRKSTIAKKLIDLGIRKATAWRAIYSGSRSWWALSHISAVDRALRNSHWDARGLLSLRELWRLRNPYIVAPVQHALPWDSARS
jgi:RNA-directed DNA polymerase